MNAPVVATDAPILSMVDIVKTFGRVAAVDQVSIDVKPGKILALLGENGAGKSTLIKILAGVYKRDSGSILFHGQEIASAAAIGKRGSQPIAFIHQDLGLIEWMTVAENMAFTMGFPRRLGLVDWAEVRARADAALKAVGTDIDPDARVFELSRTEKSLLAIARAVAVDAEVLVLDEPTASLPADDVKHLFEVLERLRQRQVGMIYVTHRLDEVVEITGHPIGGVCPFGLRQPLPIYCDVSLRRFAEVLPAAGAVNAAVRIATERLAEITDATWVDICQ